METIGESYAYLTRQPLKNEENEEIDRGLLKSFLLPRTVVPDVCDMGKRVLPTVQVLSEIAKTRAERGKVIRETPRNQDVKAQEHDQGIRVESGWCSSLRVRGGG